MGFDFLIIEQGLTADWAKPVLIFGNLMLIGTFAPYRFTVFLLSFFPIFF
jgi:hypothetical protein